MEWKIDENLPIRTQLTEQLAAYIASGCFKPGGRFPSVRELAADAGVNPNTMQRALSELEDMGLIITNRTAGRCVTDDMEKINNVRKKQAKKQVEAFLEKMKALGFSRDEIADVINEAIKEGE